MPILDYCVRSAVTAMPDETVARAARRLLDEHVGCLIVVDKDKPIGILTDRDILQGVVMQDKDTKTTRVDAVMSRDLLVVTKDFGVFEAIWTMWESGAQRLPVVGRDGNLVGLVTFDDLLLLVGNEFLALADVHTGEGLRESGKVKAPLSNDDARQTLSADASTRSETVV